MTHEKFTETINRATDLIQQKQFGPAEQVLSDFLRGDPHNTAAEHLLGICQRKSGRLELAMRTQQGILDREPKFAAAHQEIGLCLRLSGRRADALESFRHATQIDPRLINSWKFLGDMAVQLGEEETAIHAYGQCPSESQDDPMLTRALELIKGEKLGLADIVIRSYLKRHPRDARALYQRSTIAVRQGAISEAMELLEQTLAIDPSNLKARYDYVSLLSRRQRYAEALSGADLLLRADPAKQDYLLLKAVLLERTGQYEEALKILHAILKANPAQASVWTGVGVLQRTLGQRALAIASLRKAIDHDPDRSDAWYQLADMRAYQFTDGQIEAMRRAVERAPKDSEDEINLSFALAHALEERKQTQEAFGFFQRGNQARSRTSTFKPADFAQFIATTKSTCTPELFARLQGAGCQDPAPIFIVGLPRSGSTLVEQIITSHSQVDGLMELSHLATLIKELNFRQLKRNRAVYPQALGEIDEEECREIGQTYIERTHLLRGSAPFFVDKMPNNFEHIGLIHLALPNARIIDVRRDAMANGCSAFRQLFRSGQDWSYDLEHIAFYYLAYLDLMALWDRLFPGKIHRVHYEQLVHDPETVTRGILDFLRLPFEPACLQPERNTRPVPTASSEQVRAPVHTTAVEQWKVYETELAPLRQALVDQD